VQSRENTYFSGQQIAHTSTIQISCSGVLQYINLQQIQAPLTLYQITWQDKQKNFMFSARWTSQKIGLWIGIASWEFLNSSKATTWWFSKQRM